MTPPPDNPAIMLSHALRKHEVESAGDEVGLYTLVDKLGDGGFGSVWRAAQTEPVEREVALKIIKLGMDTLEVMSRFEQERVALSMMDHPNIAKVLDAGATPEGRPFFVMELVRGVPITTYCLEKRLPLEQRLRLFKDVCVGVQHAHQKGIIHRDLKPSNILVTEVDGVPVPKIIDFGIAKAMSGEQLTEHTLRTRAEQMMGTPLYMSPEQAEGSPDVDTRSDVYALGVLLYELLAGQPPFDMKTLMAAGYDEMRRIIREEVPARPSSKGQKGPPQTVSLLSFPSFKSFDLDLITLRALEKDRARRYESATAFAEDVQRFLNHEPVTARAPSLLYLTQRWARRHRPLSVAAVAVLLGAGVSVWQAVRATQARRAAEFQLADADAATKMITDTLAALPYYGRDFMIRRSDLLTSVAKRVTEFQGDPLRKLRLLNTLAEAVPFDSSLPLREEALRLGRTLFASDDPELWQLRHQVALNQATFAHLREQAVPELRRVYEWTLARLGPADPTTLRRAFTFARYLNFIGGAAEALPILQDLVRRSDADPKIVSAGDRVFYRLDCARTLNHLGRVDEALQMGRDNLRTAEKELGDSSFEAGRGFLAHGELCSRHDLLDEAESTLRRAVDIFLRSVGPLETYTQRTVDLLTSVYQQRGKQDPIIELNREMVRMHEQKVGLHDEATSASVKRLIDVLLKSGRKQQADQTATEWLQRIRLPGGKVPANGEAVLRGHIDVLRNLPDHPRAEAALRELFTLVATHRPDDPQRWGDQSNLADVLIKSGRKADAVPLLEEVVRELEKAPAGKVRNSHLPRAQKRL
ncbi:MAG: serine/threonine-protein kinase, partial [Verrucomicrobia bacterium]|nr:serine/threonine-protein kinase [Verrucomicrobiota bacterium]